MLTECVMLESLLSFLAYFIFYLSCRPTWQMVVQLTALNIGMVVIKHGCNHVFYSFKALIK